MNESMNSRAVSVIVSPNVNDQKTPPKFILPTSSMITAKDLLRDLAQKSLNPFSTSTASSMISVKQMIRPTPSSTIGGAATSEQSANRMSYPREFKLLVISYYFQHGQNKYRTCKEFHITKSMLNGWLQKVDKIQQSRPGSLKSGRSGRKPQFPTVEKQLYHVYQACLTSGKKVGNRWLRETAKLIAQEQCTQEELNGMCQFSERWLCNFKKRYNINLTKDWNGELVSGAGNANKIINNVKPSSDGVSYSPTPETCSSPTNFEADSSTSPKKCETPTMDVVEEADDDDDEKTYQKIIQTNLVSKSVSKKSPSANVVRKHPSSTSPIQINSLSAVEPPTMKSSSVSLPSSKIGFQPYEPGRRGRKVQFPQVEEILYKNLCGKQTDGVRVSNRWLQDEARRLAVELCPEMFTNAFKSARCMFSEHWLHNFKKRYGISLKQQQNNLSANNVNRRPSSTIPPTTTYVADKQISNETLNNILSIKQNHRSIFNNIWDLKNSIALEAAANAIGVGGYHQRFVGGEVIVADDLPTMVPLTTLSQSLTKINLAEWYSKISNANNVNECLQMLTDEVRMRKATSTSSPDKAT